jgi:hypothetical protein
MANRTFYNRLFTGECDVTILHARCSIGAAGAVSDIVGSYVDTITKESGNGNYSITLEDPYNAFLYGRVMLACQSDSTAKTCLSGVAQVDKLTFVAKASCTAGDFVIITDTNGATWAFSIDIAGTDPEPTSALWTAVAAANKVHVDISAATSDAEVAGAVRAAFAALTGIGAVITVSAVTGAYFECAHVYRKPVTVPALYKADGTATPTSVTKTQTTLGVQTAIDPTNTTGEKVTITAHGFETGRLVALSINSGSLPTGWSATNYYVIAIDANNIAFGTTLANAEAGTKVTISDYGDAAKTLTLTPVAPFGSSVGGVEFTSVTLKSDVQSKTKLTFTCYDYTGTQVNPANGSKMYIELHLRNSNVSGAGE